MALQGGTAGAELQAELDGASGASVITAGPQKGDVQVYLQLSGSANASILTEESGEPGHPEGPGQGWQPVVCKR